MGTLPFQATEKQVWKARPRVTVDNRIPTSGGTLSGRPEELPDALVSGTKVERLRVCCRMDLGSYCGVCGGTVQLISGLTRDCEFRDVWWANSMVGSPLFID